VFLHIHHTIRGFVVDGDEKRDGADIKKGGCDLRDGEQKQAVREQVAPASGGADVQVLCAWQVKINNTLACSSALKGQGRD
jgi:hypothetical protein